MATKCNLIIDSCCDLPFEMIDHEGIEMLQFPYIIDDVEFSDDLYQSTSAADFYQKMRHGAQPSTAQISVTSMQDAFTRAAQSGIPAVYISFSSGLSGTFDVAAMLIDQVKKDYPESELYLVDSRLASVAQGLLVYEAIRQREKGMSAQELAEWATEALYYVNCEFMIEDLEVLRRGGRISGSVAFAGAKLDVKPMLSVDLEGNLVLIGVARGRKKGIKQLADFFEKRASNPGGGQLVGIAHADCPKDVERLRDALLKIDESLLFLISNVGPVIGSHVGPDMLAVTVWGEDRRENLSVADMIAKKIKRES